MSGPIAEMEGATAAAAGHEAQLGWPEDWRLRKGPLRSGMACMPSDFFAYGELRLPRSADVSPAWPHGLTAQIEDARISICRAYMGVGKAPRTKGRLDVRWQDQQSGCSRLIRSEFSAKFTDPRFDHRALAEALAASMALFYKAGSDGKPCDEPSETGESSR